MKGILKTTTALVPLVLIAGSASAADKIKLGLGGYFNAYYMVASQDDGVGQPGANVRSHGLGREGEIFFKGSTVLDNGLEAGVNIQLEAETSTDQIDESFIFFKGSFGEVRVGSDDPVTDAFLIGAPGVASGFGVNDPTFTPIGGGGNAVDANITTVTMSGDNDKLIYYSPSIYGLELGISYAPDATEESASALKTDNDAGQLSEEVAIAAMYSRDVGSVGFALYAGYAKSQLEAPGGGFNSDETQWGVGGEVSFSGFVLGASYREDDLGTSGANTDRMDWNVGLAYYMGPWGFSLAYGRTEIEAGTGAGSDELDVYELAANYNLGPGVDVAATIGSWDFQDNGNAAANENNATGATVGIRLDF